MKEIAKILGKVLLWVVICSVLLSLIISGIGKIKDALGLDWSGEEPYISKPIENGMGNLLFGDLTPEQVETLRKDENAPTCDDIFEEFKFVDVGKYVIVYRKTTDYAGNTITPNALFVKSDKGLIWDGVIGLNASLKPNWFTGVHDFSKIEFVQQDFYTLYRSTFEKVAGALAGVFFGKTVLQDKDNAITFTNFNANFCSNFYICNGFTALFKNWGNAEEELKDVTKAYILKNVLSPYFFDLDGASIYGNKDISNLSDEEKDDVGIARLQSYIDFLYNQAKDLKENESKYISLNHYFVKPIHEDLRKYYPISEENKSLYGDLEYYPAYKCNVIANCSFEKAEDLGIKRDDKKIDEYVNQTPVSPQPPVVEIVSKLNLTLTNKDNADLSAVDLKAYPVKITIGENKVVYDSLDKLTKEIALKPNVQYQYTIDSDVLLFDSYSGSFMLTEKHQSMAIPFTYKNGYVPVTVEIMSLSSVSSNDFDLSKTPVKIILNEVDGDGIYQFIYSNNNELLQEKMLLVAEGNYTYTIESEKLLFTSTSGNLTIDKLNRHFTFSYSVKVVEDYPFEFNATFESKQSTDYATRGSFVIADTFGELFDYLSVRDLVIIYSIFEKETNIGVSASNREIGKNYGYPYDCGFAINGLEDGKQYHMNIQVCSSDWVNIYGVASVEFEFKEHYINQITLTSSIIS